jgi:hypothetical protein
MIDSTKLMLLVVACGATIAGAQATPGANRTPAAVTSAQPAKNTAPTGPSTGSLARHKPVPVGLKYWLFIVEKANDHESIQREIRDNPGRFPLNIELEDMSMHIGIRPEEYATILKHILDANDRLKENETEWNTALSSFQGCAGNSAKSIPPPELTALGNEHDAIINGTIRSLKHELGNRSFHKLDTWVDLNYFAETSVPAPAIRPSRPSAPIDPVTGQAPSVLT